MLGGSDRVALHAKPTRRSFLQNWHDCACWHLSFPFLNYQLGSFLVLPIDFLHYLSLVEDQNLSSPFFCFYRILLANLCFNLFAKMSTTSHHDTPQQKQRHQQPQQRRWQEQSNAESLHLKNRQHWTTRSSSSVVLQQHLEEEEALNLVANKDSENRFDSPNAMITSGKRAESFEGRVVGHGTQPLSEALDNSFQMATDAAGQNPQVFNNNAWLSLQTSQQIPSHSETMSSNMHATSPQNRHMEEDLSVSDLLNMEFGTLC